MGQVEPSSTPQWDVGFRDGEPVQIVNTAMVREMVEGSPLGPAEGRRRLIAAGFPAELLDEPAADR